MTDLPQRGPIARRARSSDQQFVGKSTTTVWGAVVKYPHDQNGAGHSLIEYTSDPPSLAQDRAQRKRTEHRSPPPLTERDIKMNLLVMVGLLCGLITAAMTHSPQISMTVGVVAGIIAATFLPDVIAKRALRVTVKTASPGSLQEYLLESCFDPGTAELSALAYASTRGFPPGQEPAGSQALIQDMFLVHRTVAELSDTTYITEVRAELAATAENFPRTEDAVAAVHATVHEVLTSIQDYQAAEAHRQAVVDAPAHQAALEQAQERASLLSDAAKRIADAAGEIERGTETLLDHDRRFDV